MVVDERVVEQVVRRIVAARSATKENGRPEFPVIPVAVSARHAHLSRGDMDILFGEGSELTKIKTLMGGQFAAKEQVTIIGPSLRPIEKVRILGPLRKQTQVEVSATDTYVLKVKAPVRASGDLKGSAGITVVGPKGVVKLKEGCIIANRHIHMSPEDALRFNVADGEYVNCLAEGERRTMFYGVQVRVKPEYTLEMHIDTDDANSIGFKGDKKVTMFKRDQVAVG